MSIQLIKTSMLERVVIGCCLRHPDLFERVRCMPTTALSGEATKWLWRIMGITLQWGEFSASSVVSYFETGHKLHPGQFTCDPNEIKAVIHQCLGAGQKFDASCCCIGVACTELQFRRNAAMN